MQAIMETLFDAVYLVSVITIGILMIQKCQGEKQYRLFGIMAVVLGFGDAFHLIPRAYALCTTGLEHFATALGMGKFITSIYYDHLLYSSVLCMENPLSYWWSEVTYHFGIFTGRTSNWPMPVPAKSMAQQPLSSFLGNLPQHSICPLRTSGHYTVFPKRQKTPGP